tara:strand:+ start:895 stop:1989 length:1095 start_codon:yes stop_codon:yes gene_type:complete
MSILNYLKILIFYIFYGKVEKVISAKDNPDIKTIKVTLEEKYSYNIFEIKNAILYNASVHDCAIIFENKLVDEVSYQYRYNKKIEIINGPSLENISLKIGTPRIRKKIPANIFSMLTGGGGKHNYHHWLYDVLPRIAILENTKNFTTPDYYLVPSLKHPYQRQTLEKLNIPFSKILDSRKYKHLYCDKLIVTDHPYVFNNNPTQSILNIPQWIIYWLKVKFEDNELKSDKFSKKIYIDRVDSRNRRERFIINNKEVKECLKKLGFQTVVLSEHPFTTQVEIFKNSELIVGLHGSGLSNVLFSKPGTKVIELQSLSAGDIYRNLSLQCNLDYKRISIASKNSNLTHQQGSIEVDLNELKKLIFDK